jgi:asparagine synthetase B (glutamine-hydrolysing)
VSEARELPAPVRRAAQWVASRLPHGTLGRNRLYNYGRSLRGQYANTVVAPLVAVEGGVGRTALATALGTVEEILAPWFKELGETSLLASVMLVDQLTYLPGDILTKVDRASMAVSLEARVPLLDHPLAEFANSLHTRFKVADGTGKLLFKQAVQGIVPDQVLSKPKQGFAVPLAQWFRGPLRERLEMIRGPYAQVAPYVDPVALKRLVAEHLRSRRDHSAMLWRLLALELWLRRVHSPAARAA